MAALHSKYVDVVSFEGHTYIPSINVLVGHADPNHNYIPHVHSQTGFNSSKPRSDGRKNCVLAEEILLENTLDGCLMALKFMDSSQKMAKFQI